MTKNTNIILGIALALAILGLGYSLSLYTNTAGASVSVSDEYNATTTGEFMTTTGTTAILYVKPGQGALGSIVLNGAAAGEIFVYDATTTDANLRVTAATSSLMRVNIPLSAAVGTYTYDISMPTGIIVEVIGVAPTTTITFR